MILHFHGYSTASGAGVKLFQSRSPRNPKLAVPSLGGSHNKD